MVLLRALRALRGENWVAAAAPGLSPFAFFCPLHFAEKTRWMVARRGKNGYQSRVPTVGEQLKQAREAQKLGMHEVVDITKIRGDHLRALEEGNYSVFSAPVYIRGFVRSYATLLKLDTAQILEQLGHELADSGQVDPTLAPASGSLLDSAMFQLSKFSRRLI